MRVKGRRESLVLRVHYRGDRIKRMLLCNLWMPDDEVSIAFEIIKYTVPGRESRGRSNTYHVCCSKEM